MQQRLDILPHVHYCSTRHRAPRTGIVRPTTWNSEKEPRGPTRHGTVLGCVHCPGFGVGAFGCAHARGESADYDHGGRDDLAAATAMQSAPTAAG